MFLQITPNVVVPVGDIKRLTGFPDGTTDVMLSDGDVVHTDHKLSWFTRVLDNYHMLVRIPKEGD